MPRYIDADDLKSKLISSGAIGEFGLYLIDNQPAADVAPVVHGHWIKEKPDAIVHWGCSACRNCYYLDEPNAKYCPNCGAKMDGVVSEEK